MELREIKKIIALMKANELSEFEMEDEGFRIAIKRGNGKETQVVIPAVGPAPIVMSPQAVAPQASAPAGDTVVDSGAAREDEGLLDITSPMVGTFYRAASPEADSFVSVGETVDEDTVVCIVEAMKVMNEIKAEVAGVIRKIEAENATPVEFGQVLFKVEPQ